MIRRVALALAILFMMAVFAQSATATSGYRVEVNTTDFLSNITYDSDGIASFGSGYGFVTVHNPTVSSQLLSVNLTLWDGMQPIFVESIAPSSDYSNRYDLCATSVQVPLKVKESITPTSLVAAGQHEIIINVDVENTGAADVTGFEYLKQLPAGLVPEPGSGDGSVQVIGGNLTWTIDRIKPGEQKHLVAVFDIVPATDIYLPGAYISFTYSSSFVNGDPSIASSSDMPMVLQKLKPNPSTWAAGVNVPDNSEFMMKVDTVLLYRADVSSPFVTSLLKTYTPNTLIGPGESWSADYMDTYGGTPVYYMSLSYSIPYTITRNSYPLTPARTLPRVISVSHVPPAAPVDIPSIPYDIGSSPADPAQPSGHEVQIEFVLPKPNDTITDNTTALDVSVIPANDIGFVAFYQSTDNVTWTYIGKSGLHDNISEYTWTVPPVNRVYYLKAEYYDSMGLRGSAYDQVFVHHEQGIDISTMFIRTTDWLIVLIALITLLLAIVYTMRGGSRN